MTIILTSDDGGGVTLTSAEVPYCSYQAPPIALETILSLIRGLVPQVLTDVK